MLSNFQRLFIFLLSLMPLQPTMIEKSHSNITLFGSITMFCETDNIMWNISTFDLNVENIP